jgi:hypothetical protein
MAKKTEHHQDKINRYIAEGRTVSGGHDLPGVSKFLVTDENFEPLVGAAIAAGSTLLASVGDYLVLQHGYGPKNSSSSPKKAAGR